MSVHTNIFLCDSQFTQRVYELLHQSMDEFILAQAKCNAHGDILQLDTHPEDEHEDVSAAAMMRTQLKLDGAESEVDTLQELINNLSALLSIRQSRRILFDERFPAESCPSGAPTGPKPAATPQDNSYLPHLPQEDTSPADCDCSL